MLNEDPEKMSYDSEEKLPESLEKLQLVPYDTNSQSECLRNRNGNPFVVNIPTKAGNEEQKIQIKLFGPTCSHCKHNESNSNHPIKLKSPESLRKFMESRSISFIIPDPLRFRKMCHISAFDSERRRFLNRRSFLREPILKRIGRSVHHRTTDDDDDDDDNDKSGDCELDVLRISRHSLRIRTRRKKSNSVSICSRLSIDVSSLVDECVNLSLRENDLTDKCQTKKLELRPTSFKANRSIVATTAANGTSSSSSCSQQARMPSNSCDVTMDELASYFETFVHIPKKMSSMAEMMYI